MVVRFFLGPFRRKPGPERRAGNASDSKAADAQGASLVGLPRQTALEETDKHNACPLITCKNGSDNAATTKVWRSAGYCVPFFGFSRLEHLTVQKMFSHHRAAATCKISTSNTFCDMHSNLLHGHHFMIIHADRLVLRHAIAWSTLPNFPQFS